MLPVLARKAIGAGGKVMAQKIMGRKEKVNPNQQFDNAILFPKLNLFQNPFQKVSYILLEYKSFRSKHTQDPN